MPAPFTTPIAELPYEPNEVQAFIDSTEPRCVAHRVAAAGDANDLEYTARELVSFWRRSSARLANMSYATKGFDADDYLARLVDQSTEDLTPDAARLFSKFVEFYAAPDEPVRQPEQKEAA